MVLIAKLKHSLRKSYSRILIMSMPLLVARKRFLQLKKSIWLLSALKLIRVVGYHSILSQGFYLHIIAEWLTAKLHTCHRKWEQIEQEVDMRRLQATLTKGEDGPRTEKASAASRGERRVYGAGGVVEKLLRDEYQRGLRKMCTSSFKSKAAKEEWLVFVEQLDKDGLLGLVTDDDWE
jgi:hypothetical protein